MRLISKVAAAVGVAAASVLAMGAGPATLPNIRINDTAVYPESLSAAPDGSVYIGSMKGIVYRAPPGGSVAEPWVRPTPQNGILTLLGVLVDAPHDTLWLCSAPNLFAGGPPAGVTSVVALELKTGAPKGNYPFPAPGGTCNDIAIDKDGTAYAADTSGGRILRLRPGAKALEVYAADPRLQGIDGIVFSGDWTMYLNIVSKGQLMRVERKADGSFENLTDLKLSQPVAGPDGFRLIEGARFLLAEGNGGKIDEVTIQGDTATIRVLREGLMSPPGVTLVGRTAYGLEGKIGYLIDPKLKGQDPGAFVVHAIPLP